MDGSRLLEAVSVSSEGRLVGSLSAVMRLPFALAGSDYKNASSVSSIDAQPALVPCSRRG